MPTNNDNNANELVGAQAPASALLPIEQYVVDNGGEADCTCPGCQDFRHQYRASVLGSSATLAGDISASTYGTIVPLQAAAGGYGGDARGIGSAGGSGGSGGAGTYGAVQYIEGLRDWTGLTRTRVVAPKAKNDAVVEMYNIVKGLNKK